MNDLAASVTGKQAPRQGRGRGAGRLRNLRDLVVLLAIILGLPAVISRFVIGGDCRQVAASFAIWFGLLLAGLVLPKGGTGAEKGGWFLIFAMFTTIFAVPVITLVQRVGGWILLASN